MGQEIDSEARAEWQDVCDQVIATLTACFEALNDLDIGHSMSEEAEEEAVLRMTHSLSSWMLVSDMTLRGKTVVSPAGALWHGELWPRVAAAQLQLPLKI